MKKEILKMLSDASVAVGENYEQRSIQYNDFDHLADVIILKIKTYSNKKLELAAKSLDKDGCYDSGANCSLDSNENRIIALKD